MTNERDKQKLKQSKQKQYNTKHDIKDLNLSLLSSGIMYCLRESVVFAWLRDLG